MIQEVKLTAGEQAAANERTAAYTELAQQMSKITAASGGAVDIMQWMILIRQLDIAVNVLANLVFAKPLVAAEPHPNAPADADKPYPLGITLAPLTREAFLRECTRMAQEHSSLLLRQLLSAGAARPDGSPPGKQ